jgi:hypothetical protein
MPYFRPTTRVLAALLALGVGVESRAADWQQIATDQELNRYAVDASRIVRSEGIVRASVRTEYSKPRERTDVEKPIFYAVDRLAVRCAERSFALESRTYVTADGEEILALATARDELEFRGVVDGSTSAAIVRYLCGSAGGR